MGEHLPSSGQIAEAADVAAHCAIYTKTADSRRALVLMHMRFDGKLGFAGGLIDPEDASVVQGLNRELREELNLDTSRFEIKDEDFVMCRHGLIKLSVYFLSHRFYVSSIPIFRGHGPEFMFSALVFFQYTAKLPFGALKSSTLHNQYK